MENDPSLISSLSNTNLPLFFFFLWLFLVAPWCIVAVVFVIVKLKGGDIVLSLQPIVMDGLVFVVAGDIILWLVLFYCCFIVALLLESGDQTE